MIKRLRFPGLCMQMSGLTRGGNRGGYAPGAVSVPQSMLPPVVPLAATPVLPTRRFAPACEQKLEKLEKKKNRKIEKQEKQTLTQPGPMRAIMWVRAQN